MFPLSAYKGSPSAPLPLHATTPTPTVFSGEPPPENPQNFELQRASHGDSRLSHPRLKPAPPRPSPHSNESIPTGPQPVAPPGHVGEEGRTGRAQPELDPSTGATPRGSHHHRRAPHSAV